MGSEHSRGLIGIAVLSAALWGAGCSEDEAPPPADTAPPEVVLAFPPKFVDEPFTISDSTIVLVAARDETGIADVQVFFSRPGDTQRRLIGATDDPVELGSLPDTIARHVDAPDGFSLYAVRWSTAQIASGSFPQLIARAADPLGNIANSSDVTVYILNRGADLVPPVTDFIISPPNGTILQEFVFDPRGRTYDPNEIDPPERVQVRWDFNGDARESDVDESRWEVKWSDRANATETQQYTFATPGNYTPKLEARNSYLEEGSTVRQLSLVVFPDRLPSPPNPEDYVELALGEYVVGCTDSSLIAAGVADRDEFPSHRVRFNSLTKISRYEVTNRLYREFLEAAIVDQPGGDPPLVRLQANQIFLNLPDVVPPPDSSAILAVLLSDSRIFYDPDQKGFRVSEGYDEHPMTGVSFAGADAYCRYYGMRLPTESEWEVAARGDSSAWHYPFGRSLTEGDPTGTRRVNYERSGDPFDDDNGSILDGSTPVGAYDGSDLQGFETVDTPTPFGLYDMSGNVAEWVTDWYGPYESGLLEDPQGPLTGTARVIRGGSHAQAPRGVRVTVRAIGEFGETYPTVGFRPAYTVFN